MEKNDEPILRALAEMTLQYIGDRQSDYIDTQCMSAGQQAIEVLAKYGLVKILDEHSRCARWTAAGKALLHRQ